MEMKTLTFKRVQQGKGCGTYAVMLKQCGNTYIIRLLFKRSVLSLGKRGKLSTFRISLSERSIVSNWFYKYVR